MAFREQMARSFGSQAAAYQAGRPDYPEVAAGWLLEPVSRRSVRVADVGAGTGKLTRALLAAGAGEVVAIDPDAAMLAALRTALPGVPTHEGTAEHLPLDDASVDAVVLGQAWHWVDPAAASAEIARVLRPGGVLGLIWNVRDETTPWVAELSRIMHPSSAETMLQGDGPVVAAPFSALQAHAWRWSAPMNRAGVIAMARSRSAVITATEAERARIEAQLAGLLDELGLEGDVTIPMPYITRAFRAVRP